MKQKHVKWIAFGSLILLVIIMAIATILEKVYGREAIFNNLYGAWWFVALWAILSISAIIYIFQKKLYKRKAAFLLHVAFLCILLGALTTYLFSDKGYMHIRQGEILNYYISDNDSERHPLPFNIKLLLFDIEYHQDSDEPADFKSFVKIDDEVFQISMNNILKRNGYRLYQHSYDSDEMGATWLVNYDPWGTGITYIGYILLVIAVFWTLWIRIGWKGLLWTIVPTACVWFYISQLNPMTPVLRSPMLAAHVSVIMVAYALFLFIAVSGIVALCAKKYSEKVYRINSKLLYPALFLLSIGIFIGAVWANISWGRYWGWDAKETWALITMLIYAIPLHKQSFVQFNEPVKFHRYCTLAFLAVAMTFFGVTFLLGGIHSYV